MTIHSEHPFALPEDALRRFRGRLGGQVSLWTTGSGADRAGLTVSSLLAVDGPEPRLIALIDPDSDLADALTRTPRALCCLLTWSHRDLAEMFAGRAPAPGGLFSQAEFTETDWGPLVDGATTWAGVRIEESREVGWSREITAVIEELRIGSDEQPLQHRRGRYLGGSG